MAVCWRCGVEFDDSEYIKDVPCPDCQLDAPEIEYRRFDVVRKAEKTRLAAIVGDYWHENMSDRQIAAEIGVSAQTVAYVREDLGLKAHSNAELLKNADLSDHMRQLSRKYWDNPNRTPRKRKNTAKPVGGTMTNDKVRAAHDERYK